MHAGTSVCRAAYTAIPISGDFEVVQSTLESFFECHSAKGSQLLLQSLTHRSYPAVVAKIKLFISASNVRSKSFRSPVLSVDLDVFISYHLSAEQNTQPNGLTSAHKAAVCSRKIAAFATVSSKLYNISTTLFTYRRSRTWRR